MSPDTRPPKLPRRTQNRPLFSPTHRLMACHAGCYRE